jgi:hypothetical protein
LKYDLIPDDEIEKASRFEIHLIEVKADDTSLRLDGKILALKGISSKEEYSQGILGLKFKKEDDSNEGIIVKSVEKNIPTKKKISFKEFARQQRLKNNT